MGRRGARVVVALVASMGAWVAVVAETVVTWVAAAPSRWLWRTWRGGRSAGPSVAFVSVTERSYQLRMGIEQQ